MYFPQISPQLKELLQSDAPVIDVLKDSSSYSAYCYDEAFTNFINSNVEEVFRIALLDEEAQASARAMEIFQAQNGIIFSNIQSEVLVQNSETVFTEESSIAKISKFAFLIKFYFLSPVAEIYPTLPFLEKFIPFLRHKAVYILFESFVEPDQKGNPMTAIITNHQILDKLFTYIQELPNELPVEKSKTLINVYKLLTRYVYNETLLPLVLQNTEVLLKTFENSPVLLLNAKWKFFSDAYNAQNISKLQTQLDTLLKFILEHEHVNSFQVSALSVLQRLLQNEQNQEVFENQKVGEAIGEIILAFPGHSLFHNAIIEFVFSFSGYPPFSTYLFNIILPICSKILEELESLTLRAFAWNFIRVFKEKCDQNEELRSYAEGLEGTVFTHNVDNIIYDKSTLATAQYGGDLPKQSEDNSQFLAEIARLMSLLSQGGGNQ